MFNYLHMASSIVLRPNVLHRLERELKWEGCIANTTQSRSAHLNKLMKVCLTVSFSFWLETSLKFKTRMQRTPNKQSRQTFLTHWNVQNLKKKNCFNHELKQYASFSQRACITCHNHSSCMQTNICFHLHCQTKRSPNESLKHGACQDALALLVTWSVILSCSFHRTESKSGNNIFFLEKILTRWPYCSGP